MGGGRRAVFHAACVAGAFAMSGCGLIHQITGPSNVAIQSFRADPPTITAGSQALLSWNVSGADAIRIDNGIGTVQQKGSLNVAPSWSTTYVLEAKSGSLSTQASITVRVIPASANPSAPAPPPTTTPGPPPSPTPQPTPSATPTPNPPSTGGPVAKANVGVIFVVCDNQGLPNSEDAANVQVGCKVHMIVNLKDGHNVQTDNRGPINWHFTPGRLVDVLPDPESPILKVLSAGDLSVWVDVDGITSNTYHLHFYN